MYRISCFALVKKNFLHYKEGSIVGMALSANPYYSEEELVKISVKNDKYDFFCNTIAWETFNIYFDIITFVAGYERTGQVPVYEGKIYW